MIIELAPAKINLTLKVGKLLENGLHELRSLVAFCEGDFIALELAARDQIKRTGAMAGELPPVDKCLVAKARDLWRAHHKVSKPVSIYLTKTLPSEAGLGGGSSDAAALIKALDRLFSRTSPPELLNQIGADVPVCFAARASLMEGWGQKVTPMPHALPEKCPVIIAVPQARLLTATVFGNYRSNDSESKQDSKRDVPNFSNVKELCKWCKSEGNDLQEAASKTLPELASLIDLVAQAEGVEYSAISGSGSAVFGICNKPKSTQQSNPQAALEFIKSKNMKLRYLSWGFLL